MSKTSSKGRRKSGQEAPSGTSGQYRRPAATSGDARPAASAGGGIRPGAYPRISGPALLREWHPGNRRPAADEDSNVTRATFYRHFPSKDDLVLAYLEARKERARAAVQAIIDRFPGDPRGALHAWGIEFTQDGTVDEYRGCTFVNAAAEYGRPGHPVRMMAVAQRRWVNETTLSLLRAVGHPDPVAAARVLLALRTGYVYSLGLEEDAGWAEQFLDACDRVIDARRGRQEAASAGIKVSVFMFLTFTDGRGQNDMQSADPRERGRRWASIRCERRTCRPLRKGDRA